MDLTVSRLRKYFRYMDIRRSAWYPERLDIGILVRFAVRCVKLLMKRNLWDDCTELDGHMNNIVA